VRICLYTETALPKLGGQQFVVDAMARTLTAQGHRVVVLTQHPRRPLKADDAGLPYPVVRHPRFVSTQTFVSVYRRFLLGLHRRERFDVVHCHSVYPTGWIAGLCRGQLGVPVVVTSHGGDVREGNVRLQKPALVRRHTEALEWADALVSMSRFTRDGYLRLYPQADHIVPIPNGVDLAPFDAPAPRPGTLPPDVRPAGYALFMGRLAQQKGVDVLLEALARTPGRGGVDLVVAGEGDERGALEALAAKSGLTSRVFFAGRTTGADKTYLFQNARFTVMPSRRAEAFPLVVLESYAAGKPLIGTRIPGLQDLVEPGRTGALVPEQSVEELAEALATFFADGAPLAEMGAVARKVAETMSWDSVCRRHVELFQALIDGKRLSGGTWNG
jgi:glycosyltransferase involved in cell wall biosynthesis